MIELLKQLSAVLILLSSTLTGMFEPIFGAVDSCSTTPMVYNSTEYRIFRYLAKLEENKGTEYWDNPNVQKVLTDGKPNIAKVKALFEERGIGDGFDSAVFDLRSRGDLSGFSLKSACVSKYKEIENAEFIKRTTVSNTATTTP